MIRKKVSSIGRWPASVKSPGGVELSSRAYIDGQEGIADQQSGVRHSLKRDAFRVCCRWWNPKIFRLEILVKNKIAGRFLPVGLVYCEGSITSAWLLAFGGRGAR